MGRWNVTKRIWFETVARAHVGLRKRNETHTSVTPTGRCGGPFVRNRRVCSHTAKHRTKRTCQLHQLGNGTLRNGHGSKPARMLTLPCETERNAHVSYSSGAMEEGLRRFESPVASHPAKQGTHKSATKHGNFSGAMERYVTI